MDDDIVEYPHAVFAVDARPLCVWDYDLERHNLDFCRSVNPDWFIDSIAAHLEGQDIETIHDLDQTAALAVRQSYHHALETFFAFLFATIQAPFCLPAWLELYDIKDLCSLIRRVNYQDIILNAWGTPRFTWYELAKLFQSAWIDKENGEATIKGIATAWSRLATELCDEASRAEYNSVKHGFRARPGGFVLRMGIEEVPGTPAPPESMRTVGASKHGWSSFVLAPIPESVSKRKAAHFHMRRRSGNWLVDSTFGKLQILTVSMGNVLATAQIKNGVAAETLQFHRLADLDDYSKPWHKSPGVTSSEFAVEGPGDGVLSFTAEQLLTRMRDASGLTEDEPGAT